MGLTRLKGYLRTSSKLKAEKKTTLLGCQTNSVLHIYRTGVPISFLAISKGPTLSTRSFSLVFTHGCLHLRLSNGNWNLSHTRNLLDFSFCCKGFQRIFINLETMKVTYHEFNIKNNAKFWCLWIEAHSYLVMQQWMQVLLQQIFFKNLYIC